MSEMLLEHFDLLATAPGGVARLRELILTLAVQGKLVPQDPTDESASVLLQKIRAEKDRLIAEGKIKRDKPLTPITDEEKPFELPQGWEWARLGTIGNIFNGNSINATEKEAKYSRVDGFPYIATKDVGYGFDPFDYCNGIYIPFAESKFRVAHEGAVLICAEGGSAGRKCGLTDRDICFGNKLFANEPYGKISSRFLLCIYLSPDFRASFSAEMTGIIGGVSIARFVEILISIPPLAEQSRIVSRVEELMRLCDALEANGQLDATQHAQLLQSLLGTLTDSATPEELAANWQRVAAHFDLLLDRPEAVDALEQIILQLAVRGLLVPQDPNDEPASVLLQKIRAEKDRLISEGKIKRDKPLPPITDEEKPFELPDGWGWVRLRDLVTHLGDGLHGTPNYSPNGGYFFVNGNNLGEGVITIKPETKRVDQGEFEKYRKPLDETSVLLSINGTLGRVAFYRSEMIVLGKSACYFNVTFGFQKLFAKLLLECPYFMTYAENSATGTTIKNLGLKAIGDWPIALPPVAEQSRIVARVEELCQLCNDLRQRLTASHSTQVHLAEALVEDLAA